MEVLGKPQRQVVEAIKKDVLLPVIANLPPDLQLLNQTDESFIHSISHLPTDAKSPPLVLLSIFA